jgi:CRISPR/Cas system-associated exonuclease Cas4 (RecB family)
MSIVKVAFENHADRRESSIWFRGRQKTVGASEIGGCARKTFYFKNPQLDARDRDYRQGWGATTRGSVIENNFFLPALRKHYGNKLLYAGSEQKRLSSGNLSGTPDGLLVKQPRDVLADLMVPDIGPSSELVLECKSIDPRINLSDAKIGHIFQAQVQMGLFHTTTRHRPDYAVIVYVNASFFDDSLEFVVAYDPEILATAHQRADQIMAATRADALSPEGWIAGGEECKYCPFAKTCAQLRGDVPSVDAKPEQDPQFVAQVKELAIAERTLDTKIDELDTRRRGLQEQIKELLRARKLRKIDAGDIKVTWSSVVGRPAYDMPGIKQAAAAAGIDIQKFERVGNPSDRLIIHVAKQDRLVAPRSAEVV